MKSFKRPSARLGVLALSALLAAGPLAARTPAKSKAAAPEAPTEQAAPASAGNQTNYGVKLGAFFTEEHKNAARNAFVQRYAKGKDCPPGMERGAKGCAAPVQGRYWAVGQRLQPAVKPFPVPEPIKAKLPPVPDGYEYVLAGEDVLLVSKALHLVVDMIELTG